MPQIPNRSGTPIKREQIAPSRRVDVDAIEGALDSQQNQINQKANASTVGGLATAVNSKASQSAVDALAGTVAGKADAAALASKANLADLATKADISALASKANSADVTVALAAKADAAALAAKANASDVSTALANKADASALAAKASASDLTALAATVPVIANEVPQPETTGGQAGLEGMKVLGAKHQHPRLTSTTKATIAAGSTVQIAFTRTFVNSPGITCTEVPPDTGIMSANPATFRVESWVREVMAPTPSGAYTGCVIKVWRSRPLPTMAPLSLTAILTAVVTGVNALIAALTNYDIFGASAVGTTFSCIAVQRSDVA
ncbi:MAG: hypothetical protein ABIV36_16080 [Sphingobium limneticum]